jgi:rSAM/selenodomain-associated transferase 1
MHELARLEVMVQEGDDLGERLVRLFQERLHQGAPRVVVIGSDSPTLDADYLHSAFAAIEDHDIVIGPAEDGGYLLIGCARLHVRPFQRIPWGTSKVLAETKRRLRREKIPYALLRSGHDLDTREDLIRTYRELEHLEEVGAPPPAPRTLQALREILWSRQEWLQTM